MKSTRRSIFRTIIAALAASAAFFKSSRAVAGATPPAGGPVPPSYYVVGQWPTPELIVKYQANGRVFKETVRLALHPIVSIDNVWIDGIGPLQPIGAPDPQQPRTFKYPFSA